MNGVAKQMKALSKVSLPLTNITVDLGALTKEVDSVTVDGEETCKQISKAVTAYNAALII